LIHCSAGVGRTGTYIALDSLMQSIDDPSTNFKLNIFDCVSRLRQYRQNLVQTYKQYAFIYDALNEYCSHGLTKIKLKNFKSKYTYLLLKSESKTHATNMETEFSLFSQPDSFVSLPYLYQDAVRLSTEATSATNKSKNRDSVNIAYDFNRYILPVPDLNSSSYINASLVEFVHVSNSTNFLVTQDPMQETLIDFLFMIAFTECDLIVSLNNAFENVCKIFVYFF
jgi:protein tyrosine phosphatase